jgi:hypothetical protein
MVNKRRDALMAPIQPVVPLAAVLVRVYLVVVAATLVTLVILAITAPQLATMNAWGHAIVVAVFAILLPLRLRPAQNGKRSAVRAVGLIAAVLLVVNVVEALIPGFVPTWMRCEMVVVAVLMVGVIGDVVRWAVTNED